MKRALSVLALLLAGCHQSAAQMPTHDPDIKCPSGHAPFFAEASDGSSLYHIVEYSPGKCRWEIDREGMRTAAQEEQQRRDLYFSLRSRVLTDKEMQEVADYGKYLNIDSSVPYNEGDKAKELNDALLTQFKLRLAAAEQHPASKK